MLEIVVKADNLKDLKNNLENVLKELDVGSPKPNTPSKKKKKATSKKAKESTKTVAEDETIEHSSPVKVDSVATYEALQKVSEVKGIQAARECLDKFKCNRISALEEKDYKPFVEYCYQLVEA